MPNFTEYQAHVFVGDKIILADLIQHDGKFWIVTEWLGLPDKKTIQPSRIILLDSYKYQPPMNNDHLFFLNEPIPEDVFYGQSTSGDTVLDLPDIFVCMPLSN